MRGWMEKATLVAGLTALALAHAPARAADKITFVSANIPPFSIKEGPRPGFVREIVHEMARRAGVPFAVDYTNSWPGSQKIARGRANTVIFPLARTKRREPHYLWIQKLWDVPIIFATAPGKPKITSIAKAKALKAIGVRRGSPMVKDLQARGFTNLAIVKTPGESARNLAAGRIEALYAPWPEMAYNWKLSGANGNAARGLTTRIIHVNVAAAKASPAIDLAKWRAAFAAMEREGMVKAIVEKYLGR